MHSVPMGYIDDPVDYERRLREKFTPHRMRSTMAFSGVYLIAYEMLKHFVLEKVRGFFTSGCLDLGDEMTREEQAFYAKCVLSRSPNNRFRASLLWLVEMGAVTMAQADRLDEIYAHRNSLAHELVGYIVDPDMEPDANLLAEAVQTLRNLHRFWLDQEFGYGSFDRIEDVDLEEIRPLSMIVLEQCLLAYIDGLADGAGEGGRAAAAQTS